LLSLVLFSIFLVKHYLFSNVLQKYITTAFKKNAPTLPTEQKP
jgi:hypothetical protein